MALWRETWSISVNAHLWENKIKGEVRRSTCKRSTVTESTFHLWVSLVVLRNIGEVIILTMWRVHEQQTGQNVLTLDKEQSWWKHRSECFLTQTMKRRIRVHEAQSQVESSGCRVNLYKSRLVFILVKAVNIVEKMSYKKLFCYSLNITTRIVSHMKLTVESPETVGKSSTQPTKARLTRLPLLPLPLPPPKQWSAQTLLLYYMWKV